MSPSKGGFVPLRSIVAGASVGACAGAVAAVPLVVGPQSYLPHELHLLAAQALADAALRGCGLGAAIGALSAGAAALARGRVSRRAALFVAGVAAAAGFACAAALELSTLLLWPRYRAANSLLRVSADAGLVLALCGLLGAALRWAARRRGAAAWACSLPALLALGGAGALAALRPVASGPNLLLVTIDTLRADRVGAYGYGAARTPTLDALAREGILFETVIASAPVTLTATATLLTGLDPQQHGAAHNGFYRLRPELVTLAELLANEGYRTAAVIGNFALDHRFAVDQGFAHFDDSMTQRMDAEANTGAASARRESWWTRYRRTQPAQRFADEVTDAALAWLARAGPQPFFLWVHYMDPHTPYRPPAAFAGGADAYDGEVAFVDAELGRLRTGLGQLHPGADTLTVVTADHGESLGEHGVRGHAWVLYEQTLRVPLILHRPATRAGGQRVTHPLRGRDVARKVLGALGRSDLAARLGGDTQPARDSWWAYAQTYQARFARGDAPLRMLRDAEWKLIRPDGGAEQLFHLPSDPYELRDEAAARPGRAQRMAAQLDALLRGAEDAPEPLDPDSAERLRALGYLP